jgi:hypothetical protein
MSFLFGGTPFDGYDRGGRRSLNGGDSGGGGNTTQTTTDIPEWARGYAERALAKGEAAAGTPYQPYTGQRVADFSPTQQAAFQQVYGMQTPGEFGAAAQGVSTGFGEAAGAAGLGNQYAANAIGAANQYGNLGAMRANLYEVGDFTGANAGVDTASQAAATAAQRAAGYEAGAFGTPQAEQYMSPYQQAVTDIAKREAMTEAARMNNMLGTQAAKAGAYGGSRFGVEQALLGKSLATNLSDIQTKGLQSAYENAQAQFERDRAARLAGEQYALQGYGLQATTGIQGAQTLSQQQTAREAARMAAENLALQGSQFAAQTQLQGGQLGANTALQGGQLTSGAALQGAGLLTNLGTARQTADLQRIDALNAIGAQQQALSQKEMDTAYEDFINARDYDRLNAQYMMGLVRGAPMGSTSNVVQPTPSATSQALGLGLTALGAYKALK